MYENLYCYYHGAISKDEVKDGVRPIAGISNSALQKIAANACKALKIPDEASKTVQKVLDSHRIREGKEEALDDWTYTIYKLTYAVSFAPIFCVSKSKISSSQCQQLTLQMLLYLRYVMLLLLPSIFVLYILISVLLLWQGLHGHRKDSRS